jgi:hypothetical protein
LLENSQDIKTMQWSLGPFLQRLDSITSSYACSQSQRLSEELLNLLTTASS